MRRLWIQLVRTLLLIPLLILLLLASLGALASEGARWIEQRRDRLKREARRV